MKKALINKSTQKIILLVLLVGLIGIAGVVYLTYKVDDISKKYESVIAAGYEQKELMDEIRALLYRDQTLLLNHLKCPDQYEMWRIEKEESFIRNAVTRTIMELEDTIEDGEEKEIYHALYTNALGYLDNVDNVFRLSSNNEKNTADYYISTVMTGNINGVNDSIVKMKVLVDMDLQAAKADLEKSIISARRNAVVFIIFIVLVVIFVLRQCFRITSSMDKYRKSLEDELELKKEELIEHSRRLMEIQDNTIIGLANLIENRDGDTGLHVKRTSAFVALISKYALEQGYESSVIDADFVELLTKAAPMHDIGKIQVPDSILQKPGKLTKEEYDIMKTHAEKGGVIVSEVLEGIEEKEYIHIAQDVARYHHEKWNGQGYPEGLSERNIPVAARIMAVADVFDALISKRCYKDAFPVEDAFDIIKADAGSHFDPTLADIFLKHKDEVVSIIQQDG
ncbi:MAG: HD domain-containing protein [Lachnospiraceae bacterium]|nr:HD domain-containing protein [Lachnospiraceae bacterium]